MFENIQTQNLSCKDDNKTHTNELIQKHAITDHYALSPCPPSNDFPVVEVKPSRLTDHFETYKSAVGTLTLSTQFSQVLTKS